MNNTFKGIKNIINLNNFLSDVPRTISVNDATTSNPCDIANTFSNYFTSITQKAQENIKYSYKYFSDYLSDKCKNPFFNPPYK